MRLRVCVCGRRPLNDHKGSVDLPSFDLCRRQTAWLRGARSRLLRRAGIEHRSVIVELGAGWGLVASELCRRTGRRVIALDRRGPPCSTQTPGVELHDDVDWLAGRAEALPLADASVDLVFAQFTFLWLNPPAAIAEAVRVLVPGGILAVIEPDYDGMMEHPEQIATRQIWMAALQRAGADPRIGRKLPGLFEAAGLRVETRFPDRYEAAQPARLDLLSELPLTASQQQSLDQVKKCLAETRTAIAYLPLWMVLGEK
jgi:SAM-dependent methyltransferase